MVYSENILICIAIPLIIGILFTARGTRSFLFSFVMGMVTCLISAYISGFLRYVMGVETEEMAVFYSPMIEEVLNFCRSFSTCSFSSRRATSFTRSRSELDSGSQPLKTAAISFRVPPRGSPMF